MRRPNPWWLLAILLPLSAMLSGAEGCTSPTPLSDNFDDEIAWTTNGCADVQIYSENHDDTIAIFFRSEGQVAAATEAGHALDFTLDLGLEEAQVTVQQGERLTIETCNDVVEMGNRPDPQRTYTAVAGTAMLHIEPTDDPMYAQATLTLLEVKLESDDGYQIGMDDFGPVEASVGWLPG